MPATSPRRTDDRRPASQSSLCRLSRSCLTITPVTRLVLYDIAGEAALRAALLQHAETTELAAPFATPLHIGPERLPVPPGAPASAAAPAPVWFWDGDALSLRTAATQVLRRFVFPVTHSPAPFCLAFPFSSEVFTARALSLPDPAALDLEDAGRLLAWCVAGQTSPPSPHPCSSAGPQPVVQNDLDEVQRQAVAHRRGALRVLAPAGSGKTKTMINRVAALVADGTPPGSILVLAFNTKAAEQLEDRLGRLRVPTTRRIQDDSGVHCATFNAFGYRYQREVMKAVPQVSDDPAQASRLMRAAVWSALAAVHGAVPELCTEAGGLPRLSAAAWQPPWMTWSGRPSTPWPRLAPPSATRPPSTCACRPSSARSSRRCLSPRWSGASPPSSASSVQAFDDQISQAVLDLLGQPARRHALQARYQHVLVDEFQDLNAAQLTLVDILSRPHRRLFVVGDDDQLIYGWRFAKVENILAFPERMPVAPHSETIILTTNYRCSREVVRRADTLIRHNARRVDKQIGCRADASAGAVILCTAADWPHRAAALAGFLADARVVHDCAWKDLAVLCRYRAQQTPVAAALDAAGVPRSPLPGARLFTLPPARLLRDCLALVAGPCALDPPAVARLAPGSACRLPSCARGPAACAPGCGPSAPTPSRLWTKSCTTFPSSRPARTCVAPVPSARRRRAARRSSWRPPGCSASTTARCSPA